MNGSSVLIDQSCSTLLPSSADFLFQSWVSLQSASSINVIDTRNVGIGQLNTGI